MDGRHLKVVNRGGEGTVLRACKQRLQRGASGVRTRRDQDLRLGEECAQGGVAVGIVPGIENLHDLVEADQHRQRRSRREKRPQGARLLDIQAAVGERNRIAWFREQQGEELRQPVGLRRALDALLVYRAGGQQPDDHVESGLRACRFGQRDVCQRQGIERAGEDADPGGMSQARPSGEYHGRGWRCWIRCARSRRRASPATRGCRACGVRGRSGAGRERRSLEQQGRSVVA